MGGLGTRVGIPLGLPLPTVGSPKVSLRHAVTVEQGLEGRPQAGGRDAVFRPEVGTPAGAMDGASRLIP